jgi:hypothetical protein
MAGAGGTGGGGGLPSTGGFFGEVLVAGSSNFDFMSYHILEELVVITRNRATIDDFTRRVWMPDVAGVQPTLVRSSVGTRLGDAAVRVGAAVAGTLALT